VSLVVGGLIGLNVLPTVVYALVEPQHRRAWEPLARAPVVVDQGTYRTAVIRPAGEPGRAPGIVRGAAYSCLLLGQMFVPWLFLTLFWMRAFFLGVLLVPWLVVAWQTFWTGVSLLRRDVHAVLMARSVAGRAVALNTAMLVVLGGLSLVVTFALGLKAVEPVATVVLAMLVHAAVAIAQARLLARAAATLDLLDEATR
jgi:hypothetical protein